MNDHITWWNNVIVGLITIANLLLTDGRTDGHRSMAYASLMHSIARQKISATLAIVMVDM